LHKIAFFALAVLILVAAGCSFPKSASNANPTSTGLSNGIIFQNGFTSTLGNPTVSASSNGILFQDSFTDTNSGWPHHLTVNSSMDYASGGYRIYVTTTDLLAFAISGRSFPSNVSIGVDATKTAGPDDNYIGVICRYEDANNFYFFAISSDGYAGIAMFKDGSMSMLSGSQFAPSTAINQGAATNHIRADCIGDALTLYVNGTQVNTATDTTFDAGGDTGLMARANSTSGVDILFKNFIVSKP